MRGLAVQLAMPSASDNMSLSLADCPALAPRSSSSAIPSSVHNPVTRPPWSARHVFKTPKDSWIAPETDPLPYSTFHLGRRPATLPPSPPLGCLPLTLACATPTARLRRVTLAERAVAILGRRVTLAERAVAILGRRVTLAERARCGQE